jgi:hypothetical protein
MAVIYVGIRNWQLKIPKRGKIYQMVKTLPNGQTIYQNGRNLFPTTGHRKYQLFSFQGPSKCTQIGLKTYHLATLHCRQGFQMQQTHLIAASVSQSMKNPESVFSTSWEPKNVYPFVSIFFAR